jgi:hypothetical protein
VQKALLLFGLGAGLAGSIVATPIAELLEASFIGAGRAVRRGFGVLRR